jgi:hypothetical protein
MISYFLENLKPSDIDLEKLQSIGLGYAFEDSTLSCGEIHANGPNNGGRGVVVSRDAMSSRIAGQTWKRHQSVDGCWIGYPETLDVAALMRPSWESIPSYTLKGWKIPIARAWVGIETPITMLPKKLSFDGKSFAPGDIIDRYARLEEIGTIAADMLIGSESSDYELPDNYFELTFEVLSMVYLIGPQEFAEIGPVEYSAASAFQVLACVADLAMWNELIESKKKECDSQD